MFKHVVLVAVLAISAVMAETAEKPESNNVIKICLPPKENGEEDCFNLDLTGLDETLELIAHKLVEAYEDFVNSLQEGSKSSTTVAPLTRSKRGIFAKANSDETFESLYNKYKNLKERKDQMIKKGAKGIFNLFWQVLQGIDNQISKVVEKLKSYKGKFEDRVNEASETDYLSELFTPQ